jgi:hypothetical protein
VEITKLKVIANGNFKKEIVMNSIEGDFSNIDIGRWFRSKGFEKIEFRNGKEFVITRWLDHPISFKLIEVENFTTFIKSTFGGSLLVFECKIEEGKIEYNCYSPIWLFGIWNIKLEFKKNPTYFFKYLKEGHEIKEKFDLYINKVPPAIK